MDEAIKRNIDLIGTPSLLASTCHKNFDLKYQL